MKRIITLATVTVLAGAAACLDAPELFDPGESKRMKVTLPSGEVHLYEEDTVRVPIEHDPDVRLAAQLLLLDSAGAVRWRSGQEPVTAGVATIPVGEVGLDLARGAPVLMTVSVVDDEGRRFYASDDSVVVMRLSGAARRPARVWAGRRVATAHAIGSRDLTPDPDRYVAYFPVAGTQSVGVLDLSGGGRTSGAIQVGIRADQLAYRSGILAVLGVGGDRVTLVRLGSPAPAAVGFPALELEMDTTFVGAVRPVGHGLALGCADDGCSAPFALVPSAVQVLTGTARTQVEPGLLRIVSGAYAEGGSAPPLVLPRYEPAVRADTPVAVAVFGIAAPDGARAEVLRRDDVSACVSLSLGRGVVAGGRPGTAYVATGHGGPCGPGTGVLRLDGLGTQGVSVSALAVRSTLGDERLASASLIDVSDDGESVLAVAGNSVLLLDAYLRVLGSVPAADARAVAWLRGTAPARFAVADPTGVTVYDAKQLTVERRLPIGPTAGRIVFLQHPLDGTQVVAAPVLGGFVVVPVADN